MRIDSRTTKAELAEIVGPLPRDLDVVSQIIFQLRRLDGGVNPSYRSGEPSLTTAERRRRALDMVETYLNL